MGLRKAERKQRVDTFKNPWFKFTMGLRLKEIKRQWIFANNAWLRYTMGLRKLELMKKYNLTRNNWLRFTMRLRIHNAQKNMEDDSENESQGPKDTGRKVYSSKWKDIT